MHPIRFEVSSCRAKRYPTHKCSSLCSTCFFLVQYHIWQLLWGGSQNLLYQHIQKSVGGYTDTPIPGIFIYNSYWILAFLALQMIFSSVLHCRTHPHLERRTNNIDEKQKKYQRMAIPKCHTYVFSFTFLFCQIILLLTFPFPPLFLLSPTPPLPLLPHQ